MAQLHERLKELRKKNRVSQKKLAEELNVSQVAIAHWENGNREPNTGMLQKIAEYFNVSPAHLMGWDEPMSSKKGIIINVLGRVAAGIPIDAIEDIIDTEEIPEEMAKTGEFFGLQIHGDSMTPSICDGDIVIVRQQDDAESGDIVIATINGDEATCKRLRKYKDGIELISNNPSYSPFEFSNQEIEEKPVRIIGKVVELRRKF